MLHGPGLCASQAAALGVAARAASVTAGQWPGHRSSFACAEVRGLAIPFPNPPSAAHAAVSSMRRGYKFQNAGYSRLAWPGTAVEGHSD